MQIQTQCQCGAKFAFSQEQVGQAFRCSVCHQVFHVPPPGQKPVMAPSPAVEPVAPPKQYVPPPQMAPPRRSSGSGIGCLVFAFLLFLALILGGVSLLFIAADRTTSAITNSISSIDGMVRMAETLEVLANPEKIIEEYETRGYEHILSQSRNETETITNDRLYTCQILDLEANAESNLAIVSQSATIRGYVKGDVDFFGQVLTIDKDAVIHGDVNLGFAQMVDVRGTIQGKLTGGYQVLKGKDNIESGIDAEGALLDLIRRDFRDETIPKSGPKVTVEIDTTGSKETKKSQSSSSGESVTVEIDEDE